jgi:F-type H+-transporting ATPase subunit gamma
MASLKEVKGRINSIKSTRKTTSAMQMVASAKLHKAQGIIGNMLPYSESLNHVMKALLSSDYSSPLSEERTVERVALIAVSSDSSLCGAFNSNVIKDTQLLINSYPSAPENIFIYTIGKKVFDAFRKKGINITKNFVGLSSKPDYSTVAELGATLISQFEKGEIDKVDIIYHHFKSTGSQILTVDTIMPLALPDENGNEKNNTTTDYILEPDRDELLNVLIPKSIKLQLYTALLDSNVSEHAARMIAMQIATENANDLINELTVIYNKTRQQAITNELLDIVAGSMGV